jgi:hypothetical protein
MLTIIWTGPPFGRHRVENEKAAIRENRGLGLET